MEVGGVDVVDLPAGWTGLEVVAVFKCLDAEGRIGYVNRASDGLQEMEAVGMLRAATRQQEDAIDAEWIDDEDDDD